MACRPPRTPLPGARQSAPAPQEGSFPCPGREDACQVNPPFWTFVPDHQKSPFRGKAGLNEDISCGSCDRNRPPCGRFNYFRAAEEVSFTQVGVFLRKAPPTPTATPTKKARACPGRPRRLPLVFYHVVNKLTLLSFFYWHRDNPHVTVLPYKYRKGFTLHVACSGGELCPPLLSHSACVWRDLEQ